MFYFSKILIATTVIITLLITLAVVDSSRYSFSINDTPTTSSSNQSIQHNKQQLLISNTIKWNDNHNNSNGNKHSNSNTNNNTDNFNIANIEAKKINVGDINIDYKSFGSGPPIVLISGSGNVMDVWPSYFLQELSKNHKVVIFDNRGVGNTTAGTKPFSIVQFANDTAGLMDALNIQKADILGFSMASFIAQQLALLNPQKVDHLILYGASCGGQEGIAQSNAVVKTLSDAVNNRTSDPNALLSTTFPVKWMKEHPDFFKVFTSTSEIIPSSILKIQFDLVENWFSKNWSGVCNQISKITTPTLIITGTEDVAVPANNSLILVQKIPNAWLVQIKEAGHGLMYQYPEKFTIIVKTFLELT
ncbi:MAG: alpha/beta fold hydrolase [Candidatus Nitrosocosmicus sp.]